MSKHTADIIEVALLVLSVILNFWVIINLKKQK